MLTTPHILVGITLFRFLPPYLAVPATLVSHLLFDFFLPHWNPHLYTEMKKKGRLSPQSLEVILLDSSVALGLILFFATRSLKPSLVLLGSVLATLPDLVEIPYYFLAWRPRLLKRFVTFEHRHQARAKLFLGLLTQITVSAACLWLLLINL